MFLGSQPCRIATSSMKLQPMLTRQPSNKLLIRLRLRPTQLVVEMNNGGDNAEFLTQFDQQTKKRDRINPPRNRNPNPVSSPQQFLPPDMPQYALHQFMHGNMVHRQQSGGSDCVRSAPLRLRYHSENVVPPLQTSRLLLRPLELADAQQAQLLFPHWEIVRYLSKTVPWPYPPDGAYTYYRKAALPAMERGDEWHWTLRLKTEPDRMIGGIALIKRGNINRGFWLGLPWHGQGYMTEACDAVTDYWFNTLKFPLLRAPKAIANTASRRISEKSGMRMVATEEHDYVSGRLPAEIWEITAEEWNTRRTRKH
jgi:RimJ/RimL family protein N-acetyltransferase